MRTLLVVIGLAVVAAPALADDKAKAKELFDDGMKHFNVAEYPEAIAQWKQGYLLSKKPLFLFNIAQAYRFAGDCTQAMTFYESYAREEQNPKNEDEVDAGIAACKNAKPVEKKPEPVTTTTTTQQQPPPPDKTPPVQTPPPTKPVEVKPIEPTVTPEPAPEASGGTLRTIGIVTAGVGVLAGAAGIYFALQSKKWSDKLNGWDMPWTSTQSGWQTTGKADATKAWIFGGGGVVLAVAGGVMYALGGKSSEHQVAIAPTNGGAAVAWGFSF